MEQMKELIDDNFLCTLIGKTFKFYRHDPIQYVNSVFEIVGLYIDDKIYALTNRLESKTYYSKLDELSVLRLSEVEKVESALDNVQQITIPVNCEICSIKLINEHQQVLADGEPDFEAWISRALIFYLKNGLEIMFEKENWVYSDRIAIYKGYDLMTKLSDPALFEQGWEELNLKASCDRLTVEI